MIFYIALPVLILVDPDVVPITSGDSVLYSVQHTPSTPED